MKKYIDIIIFSLFFFSLNAQTKKFEKLIDTNIQSSVPIIRVDSIKDTYKYTFLDARELNEFNISHIQNATCVGYDYFDVSIIEKQLKDKSTPIIVYCSVGIRSEHIGEKLIKAGYTNVQNLYGGIFEWKNQNKKVYSKNNNETDSIHTFSKEWSKWLINGTKVYEN